MTKTNFLSLLLLGTAIACFTIVLLIAWEGGRWSAWGVSAANPVNRLVLGGVALLGWYLLRAGRPEGPRGLASLLGKPVLLVVSLAVSFWAAEHGVREYFRRSQGFNTLKHFRAYEEGSVFRPRSTTPMVEVIQLSSNRRLIYELRPGLTMQFGRKLLITNRDGLRESHDYSLDRSPESSVRIVGIGDSGMFGWGLAQEEDFLAVLETNLNQRGQASMTEVINLAVPGYNTAQEIEMLRMKGLLYRPDVVILGWCDNDWGLPSFLFDEKTFDETGVSYLWYFLFRRREFVQRTMPVVVNRNSVDLDLVDPTLLDSAGTNGVRRTLSDLQDLSNQHEFRFLVFGPLKKDILLILDELGIDSVNVFDEIPKGSVPKEWYVHSWHPRAPGHRRLAEVLEHALERRGWVETGSGE